MKHTPKWSRVKALFLHMDKGVIHVVDRHLLNEKSRFWTKGYKYLGLGSVNHKGLLQVEYHCVSKSPKS